MRYMRIRRCYCLVVCGQLGERVLPEIVPILERGLRSERADQRQGVCIGLGEILASTSRDAVLSFADGLVSITIFIYYTCGDLGFLTTHDNHSTF